MHGVSFQRKTRKRGKRGIGIDRMRQWLAYRKQHAPTTRTVISLINIVPLIDGGTHLSYLGTVQCSTQLILL